MVSDEFFSSPILNSPYEYPSRHWELDKDGQPTKNVIDRRRLAEFITPIPKAKGAKKKQLALIADDLSDQDQQYDHMATINSVRAEVDKWRAIPDSSKWRVTPETARLLKHWRHHKFNSIRPFFCQVEAVETLIWLTEVAPQIGKVGSNVLEHLKNANQEANPDLFRICLKLATGAGKTTVMAMIIAWQTVNSVRRPASKKFTHGFLLVAPGITIRDRLRVLQPNDPDSYYQSRELVPSDLMEDLKKARIVITNYHAFKLRERIDISKGGRALLKGRTGEDIQTLETEGQMLQRVMPELLGFSSLMVLNDEAHHCYRAKQVDEDLKGDDKKEADENNEAASLWISGLEALNRKIRVAGVVDLSATPFFLRGSGYIEGTLFPWTISDFSLMDALECGIVKLPRFPISDDIPDAEMPMYRNLWDHIGKKMPKRITKEGMNPNLLPVELQTSLAALYGHYEKTFVAWKEAGIGVDPCFIVVCNNTASSKLVYEYISGYKTTLPNGDPVNLPGKLELFSNFDKDGNQFSRPKTLLIDSRQLESGEGLDNSFKEVASDEIERFRREIIERTRDPRAADNITDAELLREVMNTVGKKGRLGESIRCVVSVSMLTEGWDANTVTHVQGVRAFGTQLLCEQVIGRALRRQSYDLNDQGKFDVEYADVFGIPFDFTAKPSVSKPKPPRESVHVHAVLPDREHLTIEFPRVLGYRVELPKDNLKAIFTADSSYTLTPEIVGAAKVQVSGIIGEGDVITLEHMEKVRDAQIIYELTAHLLNTEYRDGDGNPQLHLFGQLKKLVSQWFKEYFEVKGGVYPAQLLYQVIADTVCQKISKAITRSQIGDNPILATVDPYNPIGSSRSVNFHSSKELKYETSQDKCQVNWAILDSTWEGQLCKVAENHPRVVRYVKNHSLGFEVPYQMHGEAKQYRPDFILLIDDGNGPEDLLNLVIEVKGYRGEDAKIKKETMEVHWIPGVNRLRKYGRWAFGEITDIWEMDNDLEAKITQGLERIIDETTVKNSEKV